MSQYLMLLCKGHLQQVLHIFAYLKQYGQSPLLCYSTPDFNETCFIKVDWSEYYPNAVELILPKMPKHLGKPVMTTCFVDEVMQETMLLDNYKLVF